MTDQPSASLNRLLDRLIHVDGHTRVQFLLDLIKAGEVEPEDQDAAVMFTWSGEQHPFRWAEYWDELLPTTPVTDNQKAFDALPDLLTLYRGGDERHIPVWAGQAWTLDPQVAIKFAREEPGAQGSVMLTRPKPGKVAILRDVPKSRISFYITARDESEAVLHYKTLCDFARYNELLPVEDFEARVAGAAAP